jgi:hypothetical protein
MFNRGKVCLMNPEWLTRSFARNTYVIERLTEGLTHADSLLVPAFGGNGVNWLLGHILVSRGALLTLLGAAPLWDTATAARYRTGSDPLTDPADPGILPLERLLADMVASGEAIAAALGGKTADDLQVEVDGSPLGETLLGLSFHEAYHLGQLEPLRRLAGHTEKVFG